MVEPDLTDQILLLEKYLQLSKSSLLKFDLVLSRNELPNKQFLLDKIIEDSSTNV